ncbi:hypothetical protein JTB14_034107 [Gonioctena quinquepunctata]|nr:hypothetical protein JTB14_034107 [Gonioctena quinquepunctata]
MTDRLGCEKINDIMKQFLCNVPLRVFNWHDIFSQLLFDEHLQESMLNKTINSNLVHKYPVQINYAKSFLKHIIDNLERLQRCAIQETVICDELYSAYGRLVALRFSSQCFKHYLLETGDKVISLNESSNLISDGTTGLRTWQAAIALSEWIIQNKDSFREKTVLELGSGIGLAGLVLAKECSPKYTFLTDCHETVLKTLCENVQINSTQHPIDIPESANRSECSCQMKHRCQYNSETLGVHVLNLPWEEIKQEECETLGAVEIVIAADIIYDDELFEPLVNAMKCLAEFCKVEEFIFSCTERNPITLASFLKCTELAPFLITQLEVPHQKIFSWPTDTPVKIFRFTKSS